MSRYASLAVVLLVTLATIDRRVRAFIDVPAESLSKLCQMATDIAVIRVESVDVEKHAITYRKLRDLKGQYPSPNRQFGDTFTHVLRGSPNPDWHRQDVEAQDRQRDAIMKWAAVNETAVVFQRGGEQMVCVGTQWYAMRGNPPTDRHWVQAAGADSRFLRFFCGKTDELTTAIADILQGKQVTVPSMQGSAKSVSAQDAPVRRVASTAKVMDYSNLASAVIEPWSTHRGSAARTGNTDGRPGPTTPRVIWTYAADEQFIAPPLPDGQTILVSGLGAFLSPAIHSLAPAAGPARAAVQPLWTKGPPDLARPLVAAPALTGGRIVFGDGMHQTDEATLRCWRARDGMPLWELPLPGKLVHIEATPAIVDGKAYAACGNGGVVCVELTRAIAAEQERNLDDVEKELDGHWAKLLDRYKQESKLDPNLAVPPTHDMLPKARPVLRWQQGRDEWHVDAPLAVVHNRVVAASARLDDERVGKRAVMGLNPIDGSTLWTVPLEINPWAGATIVENRVLVGCSSVRMDPKRLAGGKGEVVAIDLITGSLKWRRGVPGGVLGSVAAIDGMAVFTATDGMVRCWDLDDGRERWARDTHAPYFAAPAVAAGCVYTADLRGVVHALALADGKPLWSVDLNADRPGKRASSVFGAPVLHGGRLYVATCNLEDDAGECRVFCLGDK